MTLTAYLNPVTWWRNRSPQETSYANNDISTTVSFESVPTVHLVIYRVGYLLIGNIFYPAFFHASQLADWLRRAYPLNNLQVWYRDYFHYIFPLGGVPTCGSVNSTLWSKKVWDILWNWGTIPIGTHYYGMVSDAGDFRDSQFHLFRADGHRHLGLGL